MNAGYRHPDDHGTLHDPGRLVPPYLRTGGRTAPTHALDLLTRLHATGTHQVRHVEPEHGEVLMLVRSEPMSVAEVAAHLRGTPPSVVKVLASDLIDIGALQAVPPQKDATKELLERLLAGLEKRL